MRVGCPEQERSARHRGQVDRCRDQGRTHAHPTHGSVRNLLPRGKWLLLACLRWQVAPWCRNERLRHALVPLLCQVAQSPLNSGTSRRTSWSRTWRRLSRRSRRTWARARRRASALATTRPTQRSANSFGSISATRLCRCSTTASSLSSSLTDDPGARPRCP